MHKSLESYKIFPYIAWILVVGFAFFTYTLTLKLLDEVEAISTGLEQLDVRVGIIEEQQKIRP